MHTETGDSELWCEWLRYLPPEDTKVPECPVSELQKALSKVKPGRTPGKDGVPTDVLRNMSALLVVVALLGGCT